MLSWRRAIQFAPDPSLDPDWFSGFERSQFPEENGLDLQDLDSPSNPIHFFCRRHDDAETLIDALTNQPVTPS
jgi:hypothetical protein